MKTNDLPLGQPRAPRRHGARHRRVLLLHLVTLRASAVMT